MIGVSKQKSEKKSQKCHRIVTPYLKMSHESNVKVSQNNRENVSKVSHKSHKNFAKVSKNSLENVTKVSQNNCKELVLDPENLSTKMEISTSQAKKFISRPKGSKKT